MTYKTALKSKIRFLALAVAATAVALTGLAGTASAAGKAPTKVLIQAESGGFFGYVKSPKLACKSERTVVVYKQLGATQRPAMDEEVAMDTAQANNEGYEWNLGNPGLHSGRYYARALPTPLCKAANSVTLRAQP
ncbi:MAG: hypothetical protein JST31_07455 [Actinobacteria bacterium]|nr:hypothetical protein [Actinomycetota bacterium]